MARLRAALKRGVRFGDRQAHLRLERSLQVGRGAARCLGTGRVSGAWVVAAAVLLALPGWRWPLTVRLRGPRGPLAFTIPDWAAMRVFEEVFVAGEYAAPLEVRPRRIVDL